MNQARTGMPRVLPRHTIAGASKEVIYVSGPRQPRRQASGVGANFHFAPAPGEPMKQRKLEIDLCGNSRSTTTLLCDLKQG